MSRLILVALFMLITSSASAQECTIAVYGDPAGTQLYHSPSWDQDRNVFTYSVYVVLFAENTVAAAAYSLDYPIGAYGPFLENRVTGPSGNGLVIDEPEGTSVALTECVLGFNGNPVLIDEYQFVALGDWYQIETYFEVGPNVGQHPRLPQYVGCNDQTYDCEAGPPLFVGFPISNEAQSFSEIKSLYHNN